MNMNKNWKTLAVLWLSGIILVGMGTYAATSWDFKGIMNNPKHHMMKEIWSWDMKWPSPQMENFLSGDFKGGRMHGMKGEMWDRFLGMFLNEENLTDIQKEEIKTLQEEKEAKVKEINEEFFSNIRKYIDEDKLEEFDKFIAEKDQFQGMNGERPELPDGENFRGWRPWMWDRPDFNRWDSSQISQ